MTKSRHPHHIIQPLHHDAQISRAMLTGLAVFLTYLGGTVWALCCWCLGMYYLWPLLVVTALGVCIMQLAIPTSLLGGAMDWVKNPRDWSDWAKSEVLMVMLILACVIGGVLIKDLRGPLAACGLFCAVVALALVAAELVHIAIDRICKLFGIGQYGR